MLMWPKKLERYKKNEKIKKPFWNHVYNCKKIVTKFGDIEVQKIHQHKGPISIIYIYIYNI